MISAPQMSQSLENNWLETASASPTPPGVIGKQFATTTRGPARNEFSQLVAPPSKRPPTANDATVIVLPTTDKA